MGMARYEKKTVFFSSVGVLKMDWIALACICINMVVRNGDENEIRDVLEEYIDRLCLWCSCSSVPTKRTRSCVWSKILLLRLEEYGTQHNLWLCFKFAPWKNRYINFVGKGFMVFAA